MCISMNVRLNYLIEIDTSLSVESIFHSRSLFSHVSSLLLFLPSINYAIKRTMSRICEGPRVRVLLHT